MLLFWWQVRWQTSGGVINEVEKEEMFSFFLVGCSLLDSLYIVVRDEWDKYGSTRIPVDGSNQIHSSMILGL